MTHNKKEKKTVSIRSRLIFAFIAFTVIVLVLLWLCETVFMGDIYRALKLRAVDRCADSAAEYIVDGFDTGALDEKMSDLSRRYGMCISVYGITDSGMYKTGKLLVDKHANTMCFIHNLRNSEWVNRLYASAKENGGEKKEWISLASLFGVESKDKSENNVVLTRIVETDGREYLMLFNSELVPMSATVQTIRVQLIVISIVMVAVAVVLALTLADRISKPIRKMSSEASKLALGDYDVNFDGSGCAETEQLSATLNGAAYELSKLDKMQKDLIANVSHDLRTPLTMIAGYTEAMRDLPGEATSENLQIVIDETRRLTNLVNDMVEVSRYQNGVQTIKKTVFNFTNVVQTTLERYARLREKDGYVITFEADGDVFVNADENRILQVVYNLINNAVNYTGDDKTVTICQTVGDGKVTLGVTDTGCGIPEDQLPLVWERYYKVHDFHKRENMGTGLGLSIVKSILLAHGAQFGVKSTVGEGSTFWFTLPITDEKN